MKKHKSTIDLEVFPKDSQDREIRLKKLHDAIMSGKGPYGFPPALRNKWQHATNRAMRSSLFSEISTYYMTAGASEVDNEKPADELIDKIQLHISEG